jgi:Uma2 family endonuclease
MPLLQEKEHYTYADYLEWDEGCRTEIINGEVYAMSPPLLIHQRISMKLSVKFYHYLEGKTCEVFTAPVGVRLSPSADRSDDTVLEPDLIVVCDPSKLDERGCNGAPDLVIEILSPSTSSKDKLLKFNLYLKAGVREYWVVEPEDKLVQVHILDKGRYVTSAYGISDPEEADKYFVSDVVSLTVLPGFSIDLKTIF